MLMCIDWESDQDGKYYSEDAHNDTDVGDVHNVHAVDDVDNVDDVDDVHGVDDVDDNKLTLCTKRSPRQPELSGKQRIRDTAPMYHHRAGHHWWS